MIRQAEEKDIPAIAETYTALLTWEKEHGGQSNWVLDVYPTAAVPGEKVPRGEMFVLEEDGEICASMVLNQEQLPEYAGRLRLIPFRSLGGSGLVPVFRPEQIWIDGQEAGDLLVAVSREARGNGFEAIL